MRDPEPSTHTFLLRIWIEEAADEAARQAWRGRITHLPDEADRYVHTFEEIARFIEEWLGGAVE